MTRPKLLYNKFIGKISVAFIAILTLIIISVPILAEVYDDVDVLEQVYVTVNKAARNVINNVNDLANKVNFTFDFEKKRGNLFEDFFLRDGSDDIDADKYQWRWNPISNESYAGNNSISISLTQLSTNQIIFSKTFSLNASFFEFSFYYKSSFDGNLIQSGIEVLFEDGSSDDTWGILLDRNGVTGSGGNFNITVQGAGNGWEKITARNLVDVPNRKLRVFIVNAASDISSGAIVVIDKINIVPVIS